MISLRSTRFFGPFGAFAVGVLVALGVGVLAASLSGCSGGGVLTAHLEAPPVTVSASESPTLHFVAHALTSDRIADGQVTVDVRVDGDGPGQVRVSVRKDGDMAPSGDVVRCAADTTVEIPTAALAGCDGDCSDAFTVAFAPEGLDRTTAVQLPVIIDATISYESALTAPDGDSLELVLQ